jgi:hypothetical protein
MALAVPFLNGSNSGSEDDGMDSRNRVFEDLRDMIVGGVDIGRAHGESTPAVPSHAPMMLTAMPRGRDNVMGPEDRLPDVSNDDDEPDLNLLPRRSLLLTTATSRHPARERQLWGRSSDPGDVQRISRDASSKLCQ